MKFFYLCLLLPSVSIGYGEYLRTLMRIEELYVVNRSATIEFLHKNILYINLEKR